MTRSSPAYAMLLLMTCAITLTASTQSTADTLCLPVEVVRETVENLAQGSEAIHALRIERAMHGLTLQKLANSEDTNAMLRRSNDALQGAETERKAEADSWKQAHAGERRKRKGERWLYLLGGATLGYIVAR